MIRAFAEKNGRLVPYELPDAGPGAVVWIDLVEPTEAEEARVEAALGLEVPTRDEMQEIELSARLYHEEGAAFMTANLTAQVDSGSPRIGPVTFVLAGDRLVTVRYHDPAAFATFAERAATVPVGCGTGQAVLIGLLESIIARVADILERCGRDIERITGDIFGKNGEARAAERGLERILVDIGRTADLTSNIRQSIVTIERLIGFLGQASREQDFARDLRARLKTLGRDAGSLGSHTGFLSEKTIFLLDATLGLINIQQSGTIKIFSVVAVVFLPPTLIASIYGMNFAAMPELDWTLGYPMAIGLMIVSAILPYVYFKLRGWL